MFRQSRGRRHGGRGELGRPDVDSARGRTTIWGPPRVDHDEEGAMRYLCLVYSEEEKLEAMPESEFAAFSDEHVTVDEELKKSGHSIVAEAPQPVHTATTVRVRDGRLSTTDGPFARLRSICSGSTSSRPGT
jgi:hypothetical protein